MRSGGGHICKPYPRTKGATVVDGRSENAQPGAISVAAIGRPGYLNWLARRTPEISPNYQETRSLLHIEQFGFHPSSGLRFQYLVGTRKSDPVPAAQGLT